MTKIIALTLICFLGTILGLPSSAFASSKVVALTFDDGPNGAATSQILNILQKKNVKATFFVVGKNVQLYPDVAQREVDEGNVIGNHSLDHAKNLATMSSSALTKNLRQTDAIISHLIGVHPRFFRPPYGYTSTSMRNTLHKLGYQTVLWNDDPKDWDLATSPKMITQTVLAELHPGAIVILHDGRDTHVHYSRANIIAALPGLIDAIRQRGYSFVTVDRLTH